MSIPPLVCSTPPPPDQCVEDKDHDDFDLQYNLSQEEEDDNYDYMGFSTYNHCQTPVKHIKSSTSNVSIVERSVSPTKELHNDLPNFIQEHVGSKIQPHGSAIDDKVTSYITTDHTQNAPINTIKDANEPSEIDPNILRSEKNIEDDIVEDLNLEVDNEIFDKTTVVDQINTLKDEDEIHTDISIDNIPSVIRDQRNDDGVMLTNSNAEEFPIEPTIHIDDQIDGPPTYINELIENESININNINFDNLHIQPTKPLTETEPLEQIEKVTESKFVEPDDQSRTIEKDIKPDHNSNLHSNLHDFKVEPVLDDNDDFGDFEDFQFATSSNNLPILSKHCDNENPWNNNEATDEFDDFKANFNESSNESDLNCKSSDKQKEIEHSNSINTENQIKTQSLEDFDDDDFGDFDDFKSSTEKNTSDQQMQHYPVLNLNSSETETQIMETINKVLSSIFLDEISEEKVEYETKLESHLAVTWNHLLEVDTRQPYIVNWNSSFGQKTLLKALCIDSRNILFGPKWSQNMPKYATNLTAAPLQPQKQVTGSSEATIPEKSVGKTWSDPFTSDGQESVTYAEALLLDLEHLMATLDQMANHQSTLKISDLLSQAGTIGSSSSHPPIEIGPTDLDVFEAASSSKPDKLYSSAPNIQPMRQINLPDTHIFTPTDSETPRSKTIHYKDPILLPQTAIGVTDEFPTTDSDGIDNEYWDFQDFKSKTSMQPELTTPNVTSEVAVGIQVLQPVKIEPTVPTLNWPAPGDIKETFDDFSDFVTNTTWSDKQEIPRVLDSGANFAEDTSNITHPKNESTKDEFVSSAMTAHTNIPETSTFDDEFDTFQSALPSKIESVFPNNDTSHVSDSLSSKVTPNKQPQMCTESDNQIPFTNQKSDPISFPSYSGPSKTNVFSTSNVTKVETVKNSSIQPIFLQPSLLQPMAATSSKNQNTSQILQPLSLESYSQINWPNPGIDLQDLSRFNPVETLNSLKTDLSTNSNSKHSSPVHSKKVVTQPDDDWGDFVSSKPKPPQQKKTPIVNQADDDEWSDFVSSPSVKPQNGLNTISLNISTNVNVQKNKFANKNPQIPFDIPSLNYITPKTNSQYTNDRHFQNL